MSAQTNFTAADMVVVDENGIVATVSAAKVVEESKITAKPVVKKVEAKVEEVKPEVTVEPEAEVAAEETPEVK